ncbi:MAG: hypothetical protein A4E20_11050 [Nitrospira sp. SG-bin2]|uniref:hypothetical protein n=1 Tax=Nitrospira cf. moscoviensis SBR1015 TaxID=96242 RepID=UPI000A0A6905|nr:hypothetical protein [Nitrospira cf. moscoviensis SBR1015]OQW34550.1 MAG: hypothetical protein A4E20_11050 [Nitrospira sp. SG-bin2]
MYRAVDIELIETVDDEWFGKEPRCIVPDVMKIDGQEVLYEKGSIKFSGSSDDVVKVTVTLFPGNLKVYQELRKDE